MISILIPFQRLHIPKLTMDVLNGIAPTETENREPTEETEKEAVSIRELLKQFSGIGY